MERLRIGMLELARVGMGAVWCQHVHSQVLASRVDDCVCKHKLLAGKLRVSCSVLCCLMP